MLVGQTLQNFALNDLNGQPWEFRQHHGRLVLLDFWGTWCIHCLHAIPHLKDLQLAIRALWAGSDRRLLMRKGRPRNKLQKVKRVRNRLGINYRLLMGGDRAQCPVRTQFQVQQLADPGAAG